MLGYNVLKMFCEVFILRIQSSIDLSDSHYILSHSLFGLDLFLFVVFFVRSKIQSFTKRKHIHTLIYTSYKLSLYSLRQFHSSFDACDWFNQSYKCWAHILYQMLLVSYLYPRLWSEDLGESPKLGCHPLHCTVCNSFFLLLHCNAATPFTVLAYCCTATPPVQCCNALCQNCGSEQCTWHIVQSFREMKRCVFGHKHQFMKTRFSSLNHITRRSFGSKSSTAQVNMPNFKFCPFFLNLRINFCDFRG